MENYSKSFFYLIENLVEECEIIFDRPKGCLHPRYNMQYFLDYGYLAGTQSQDKEGIDIYLGTMGNKSVNGILCTIVQLIKIQKLKY